ncbi:MAG: hypothetical protein H6Q84_114 [Deltaproteobacteria bacterium]|nr:hypothetical protein [Deltaproteobacteria bacterium]
MRTGRLGKGVAVLLAAILCAFSAGCFGKFQMTRTMYDVNRSVEQPYLRSAVTWVFLLPVYGLTGLLDFLVFNTIEFWTGENPISQDNVTKVYERGDGKTVLALSREGAATTATILRYEAGSLVSTLRVRDDGKGTVTAVETAGGRKVRESVAVALPDGSVDVTVRAAGAATVVRHSDSAVRTQMVRLSRIAQEPRWAAAKGRAFGG